MLSFRPLSVVRCPLPVVTCAGRFVRLLALAMLLAGAAGPVEAQTASRPTGPGQGARAKPGGARDKDRAAAKAERKKDAPAPAAAGAGAKAAARPPGEDFQAGIRKTVEKRRQRRARRAQAMGAAEGRPPGAIAPWPMPPALIIRQTPQVHDEIASLLGLLRRSGG